MKKFYSFKSFVLALSLVFIGFYASAQTTVTYPQQTGNYYSNWTTGTAGAFNQGANQVGMFANGGGTKQVVSWRKFRTDASGSATSDRALQVGDQFVVTISATRAFGKIGFALLASPGTGSWANRESNYAISFNLDGPAYAGSGIWGNWYARFNGGSTSVGSGNVAGQQTTYKNFTFTLTLTAPDRMNATWTDGTTTSTLNDILLNTSSPITDYSIFLEDDWDGGANRNIFWGLGAVGNQHTVTNQGTLNHGQSNSSYTIGGAMFNGLDANSISSNTLNNALIKNGTGNLTLNAANTYTGQTLINNGELWIGSTGSISLSSAISVGSGVANVAKLWLSNASGGTTFSNDFTINNGNPNTREIGGLNTSGTHTFSGFITNNPSISGLSINALNAGGTTTISGVISGGGAVFTAGSGTVIFSGASQNNYTSTFTAGAATTIFNKSANVRAVGTGNVTINTGVTLRTNANNQLGIGTVSLITINGTGVFNLNNTNQKVALASASSTASVTLGSGTLNIDNTGTDTYAGVISGTGGLTKTNTGTQILSNTGNSYTGATTITGGTLRLGAAGVIANASNLIMSGGTLSTGAPAGFSETMGTLSMTASSTIALGTGSHNITFANSSANSWTFGTILTITGWTGTNDGNSSGTAGRIFVGNTAGGLTGVQLSRIRFNISSVLYGAMQLSTGEVVPTGGTVLYWNGTGTWSTANTWSLTEGGPYNQTWVSGSHAIFNVAASSITGFTTNVAAITANQNVTVTAGGTIAFGPAGTTIAPIYVESAMTFNFNGQALTSSATAGVIKNGTGILNMGGGGTFAGGFTLNAGIAAAGGVNGLGNGPLVINGGTLTSNSATNINPAVTSITVNNDFKLGDIVNFAAATGNLTFTANVALGATTRIITLGNTSTQTFSGIISGTSSAGLTLAATALGTLAISGANTYPGATIINGGTLSCTGANTLPSTTNVTLANTSSASLTLGTFSQTINSLTGGGTTGGNVSVSSAGVLTINGTTSTTYSGILSGTGALVKSGTGILTLANAANAHTGTTTINTTSEIRLNPATNATFASQIKLNGGKLSTTGIAASRTWTSSSTLSLDANSSIDLGAAVHTITFDNSAGVTWAGSTLTINGWTGTVGSSGTGGKIFFGNTIGTLTASQLSKITFTGYAGTPILLGSGELVPPVTSVTYTWNGSAGDSNWATTTNWTPNGNPGASDNVIIPVATGLLNITGAQTVIDFTLSGTGTFQVSSTGSLTVTGNLTNSSSATPTFNCGSTFTVSGAGQTIPAWNYGNLVLSGATVTLASSGTIGICGNYTPSAGVTTLTGSIVNFNGTSGQSILINPASFRNLTVSNTAANVTASVAVTVSNLLTINSSARLDMGTNVLTITGATSAITGFLRCAVASTTPITGASTATLTFNSGGTYECNAPMSGAALSGLGIPIATWNNGSICTIIGLTNPIPGGWFGAGIVGVSFSNFRWNCTGQTTAPIMGGGTTLTTRGTFTMLSTGSSELSLASGSNGTINCGAFNQSGGTINMSAGTGIGTIILTFNAGSSGAFTQSAGTITESSSGSGLISFSSAVSQTITISNPANITNVINFRLNNTAGAVLAAGTILPINNGATLSRTAGAFSGAGSISYNTTGSNLVYDGGSNITSTNYEFPSINGPVNLQILNSGGVNLHSSRSLPASGVLTLTSGIFALGANSLTILNPALAAITGTFNSSNMVVADGSGQLIRAVNTSTFGARTWPIGDSSGDYSPVVLNFSANNTAREIGFRVVDANHPQLNTPDFQTHFISRNWPATNNAAGTYTYTGNFTYVTADINGTQANIKLNKYNGSAWAQANSTAAANVLTLAASETETTFPIDASVDYTGRVKVPSVYTWNPITGTQDFTVAANWTPTRTAPAFDDILTFPNGGSSTANNVPSQTIGQIILSGGTTIALIPSASNNILTLTGGTGTDLDIPAGSVLVLGQTTGNSLTLTYSASGHVASIAGSLTLAVNTTNFNTYITTNATTTVSGVLNNGGVVTSTAPVLIFSATGTYDHTRNAGTIPTSTWTTGTPGATCLLSGAGVTIPSGLSQSFANFTINKPTVNSTLSATGNLTNIAQNLTVALASSGVLRLQNAAASYTLNIGGNLDLQSGIIEWCDGGSSLNTSNIIIAGNLTQAASSIMQNGSGGQNVSMTVGGNFIQNGGTFTLNGTTNTITLRGNLTQNGVVQRTGGTASISFINLSGTLQTWTQTSGTNTGAISWSVGNGTLSNTLQLTTDVSLGTSAQTFTLNNNATLDFQDKILSGTNTTFTSGTTNTTIKIGSQYGITSAAAGITSGNIQTLTRTVSNLTSFVYSGTVNQVTGNLLPATLGAGKSLTISNTGTFGNNTVTLTTNNTETPQLNLVSGLFAAGAGQQLNITATTGIITGSGGNCLVGANGGTINFNGAGTINGSSAFTFNNVTINTGALAIPTGATIPTIGGTLQINGGNLTNPLYYGSASTLNYNVAYGRFVEWNASGVGTIGTTLGYPNNVTINTGVLDINNASNIARACAGNLTINNGAILSMGSMTGALIVAGDVTLGGGTSGVLTLSSSVGGDIYVGGNWTRNAGSIFNDNTRAVFFDGSANQNIGGSLSTTFSFLFLNNSAGATLTAAQTVSTALTLTNGKLTLGNFDLNCNGTISGASTARYIITNGTGQLKQTVVSSIVFPVGNSSYNPLSLTAGTTDTYGVRVLDGTITGSTIPNDVTKTINRLWAVTEGTTGGTITPAATFNSGEENNAGVFSAATQPYIGISYGTTYSHVAATSSGSTVYTASSTITPTESEYFIAVGKDDAFRAIPLITSYTPTSAYSGDVITITGTNLNALTSVTIGGVAAILTTPAATSTTANYIVGNGASGNLVVTNAAGNATASAAFTYLGYISDNNTDWNTASTWRGGNVPPVNATTTINSNITINGTVVNNPNTILVNATKSIAFGGGSIGINSSVTNNGTINMTAGGTLTMANASTFANGSATFTGGTGTVVFTGTATVTTTGGIPFNNVTINAAINLGANSSIAGTLRVNQGGSIVTNALTYGAGSTLSYNGTSSQTPNALEFPASSGPTNFTANNSVNVSLPFSRTVSGNVRILSGDLRNSSGTGVTLTMSGAAATLEVTGALQGTDIGAGNDINLIISGTTTVSGSNVTTCKVLNTTVNTGATLALARSNFEVRYGAFNINGTGTLRIDANGNVASIDGNSRVPIYASTSNLVYNSGGTYGRFVEWSTLSGPAGYPGNVTVQNGTTLNIGTPTTDLGIVSNLTLGVSGSAGSLNMQATPQGITVGGNVTIGSDVNTSTLTLSTNASSPALRVAGNWNRNSFGSFVGTGANGRGVFFNGPDAQSLTANGGETFQFLIIQKTVGSNLTLNNAVTVASDLNLTSGNIILGTNNLTLNASATISNASASSFVITNGSGYLQKVFTANGTFTWPVGDNIGTIEYTPATLNVTSSGGTLGMRVVNAPHPNNGSSLHYINRYWNTSMSATSYSWDGSFNYTTADVVGTQTNMLLNIYDPNAPNIGWTEYPSSSAAANVLTVTTGPSTGSLNNSDITGRKDVPLYYRSIASGDWSDVTKWESSTDPAFISPAPTSPVAAAPNNINSAGIQIRNTHTIIVAGSIAADDLDVQTGGVLTVDAAGNFAIVNGFAATDFTINGTFNVNNTTTLASGSSTVLNSVWNTTSASLSSLGNLLANSSAVYTHNVNGGTIPTATWSAGTTVIISGITNTAPTGLSQNFYDVEWNCPTQSAAIQLSSNPITTIQNNLTITNTGSPVNDLRLYSGASGGTTNIGGNLTINGGRLGLSNGGVSNAATVVVNVSGNVNINGGLLTFTGTTTQTANLNTLNITGNLTLNGGNVNFNSTGFVTSGNQTLNLSGNLDIQNGQILRSVATTSCVFRFNKVSGTQNYSATIPSTSLSTNQIVWEVGNSSTEPELVLNSPFIIKNGSTFSVKNNATLNCGASSYVGDDAGGTTFTLESDATIKTANTDGIVLNTGINLGSVRSGLARNFSSNANYIYNGTLNQVTGTGLPTAHTGTLEIASSAAVTLTTTNST
ncbi:MAG: autotransporter-associated beta strand repeat-containing protein, partial [Bacteroidota bacterium]